MIVQKNMVELDKQNIPNAILYKAQSDHFIWKKRLADILVGTTNETAADLTDHHHCRLGVWYAKVQDPELRNNPAFRALANPHERVHRHGKRAAELFRDGRREDAAVEYREVEKSVARGGRYATGADPRFVAEGAGGGEPADGGDAALTLSGAHNRIFVFPGLGSG